MTRRFLALVFACLALAACGTQPERRPPAHPALWAIEGPDGSAAGWLFGTIHALPDTVDWRTKTLDRALGRSGVLTVEVANLGDKAAIAQVFNRLATNDPGPPLAQRLDPATRKRLDALLDRDDVARDRFDRLETWAAALAIAQLDQSDDTDRGVDLALMKKYSGRPVVELEGAERQLGIFDALPPADQRDLLKGVLDESEEPRQQQERLAQAWAGGDLKTLQGLTRQGILADPELYDALVKRRNRVWAGEIAAMLKAGKRPFVAVGAGHMVGPDGLPALLAESGYTVRRIQ